MNELFLQEDESLFYSRSAVEPFLQINIEDLITTVPSDFEIPHNNEFPLQILDDNDDDDYINRRKPNHSFTFFMPFKIRTISRRSFIFNHIFLVPPHIFKENKKCYHAGDDDEDEELIFENNKLANFPVIQYNPDYIGIPGNIEKSILKTLNPEIDSFMVFELKHKLKQIINYFFPELKKFIS